jgi:hypothetical protein
MIRADRWRFSIVLVVLVAVSYAQAQQDGEKPAKVKPPTVQQLQKALNGTILITDPVTIPLPLALKFLEDDADHKGKYLAIDLDLAAIREVNPNSDIESVQVKLRKRERPIPLRVALQEILGEFESGPGDARLSFAIVEGSVLVGPRGAIVKKMLNQPVTLTVEGLPLRKVLRMLTEQTGVNLVLDPRSKEEPKVTMEVQDMSLKSTVLLLAEMADLRSVCLNEDGFFITTKERAERMCTERSQEAVSASNNTVGAVAGGLVGRENPASSQRGQR